MRNRKICCRGIGLSLLIAVICSSCGLVDLPATQTAQVDLVRTQTAVAVMQMTQVDLQRTQTAVVVTQTAMSPPATQIASLEPADTPTPAQPTTTHTQTNTATSTSTPTHTATATHTRTPPTPLADKSTLTDTPTSTPTPWEYRRQAEDPAESTVGQMIWRANASDEQVHGQFGCEEINTDPKKWPAKPGYVRYTHIYVPRKMEQLFLKVRYSKDSPSGVPIDVYMDDEPTPRTSFFLDYQGEKWEKFAWTDKSPLGSIDKGIHSLKFQTKGQEYGVADLDEFVLSEE